MITEVDTLLTPALLPQIYCDITEVGSLLTTLCHLTCAIMKEAFTMLSTKCYLTCTLLTEEALLFSIKMYFFKNN